MTKHRISAALAAVALATASLYAGPPLTVGGPLGPAFVPGTGAGPSADPGSLIAGQRSIRAVSRGDRDQISVLWTERAALRLRAGGTYKVAFSYRMPGAPAPALVAFFRSPTGDAAQAWLPGHRVDGRAGSSGRASFTSTLGPYDDYYLCWDAIGPGELSIDDIEVVDAATGKVIAREDAEGRPLAQGPLGAVVTSCGTFPIFPGEAGYMRSAEALDLDGDGAKEAVLTFSTYPSQLPVPVMVVAASPRPTLATGKFFPGGAPSVRHSGVSLLADLDGDGRSDLVIGDAGLDHPPWTGSGPTIAIARGDGAFQDISALVPEPARGTRSYSIVFADLYGEGRGGILMPDQSGGRNVALLTWTGSAFTSRDDWTDLALWYGDPARLRDSASVVAEDMDGDGRPDLVIGGQPMSPSVRVFYNEPKTLLRMASSLETLPDGPFGHHAPGAPYEAGTTKAEGADVEVLVADFDQDGRPDIFALEEQNLYVKPGIVADPLLPDYAELLAKGGYYYHDFAFQVFLNRGGRRFEEVSARSPKTALGFIRYYFGSEVVDVDGDGFPDVVARFMTRPYGDYPGGDFGTTFFLNDGTGAFDVVQGEELLPSFEDARGRQELGTFLPLAFDGTTMMGLALASSSQAYGSSDIIEAYRVESRRPGTGPGFTDPAARGAPGFNERYYLRRYPIAAAAVASGVFPDGLAHYLAVGRAIGYRASAANGAPPKK